MVDSSKGELYLASIYFAFSTLTTSGFGDIHAYTDAEMIMTVLWLIFGIVIYSFVIGTLTSILSSIDSHQVLVNATEHLIERFGKEKNIPEHKINEAKAYAPNYTQLIKMDIK